MSRDGGGTSELRIGMHTAKGIREAIGSRACCHVIRMQGTARAAAGCNREVLLASLKALLLVGACYRMLESGRVGGVAGDGDIHVLLPHDRNTLRYGVCAIAVDRSAYAVGVALAEDFLDGIGVRIILCLNIGETVDTGNDLRCVFSKSVQDDAQRLLTNLVCIGRNSDCTLSSREGLMTCKEAEALRLLVEQSCAQSSMSKANLTGVCDRTRDAECLKAFADCLSSVGCLAAALLDCDCSAGNVCPACVLEADRLNALDQVVDIQSGILCDLLCFLEGRDAV